MLGKGEAGQLLAKILHHVIALELAVNKHIETDILLPADGRFRFFLQECFILRIAQGALRMR
ncbi:hypothetical protein D3C72_2557530 [compost metagenome]